MHNHDTSDSRNKTRAALMKELHDPPADLAALDREDLEHLRRLLAKLMAV